MELILTLHGHTCSDSDVQIIAGKKHDFPLVEKGGIQAENLAKMLLQQNISPINVMCSGLRKTKRYAEIIIEAIGMHATPMVDERLNDLDYGDWSGLSDPEIAMKYGEKVYTSWVKYGIWPKGCSWGESPQKIHERLTVLCHDMVNFYDEKDTVLVVTNSGLIKFFLGIIEGEYERRSVNGSLRMDIGNIAKLKYQNGKWNVVYWNMNPQDMLPVPNPVAAAQKAITNATKKVMMLH